MKKSLTDKNIQAYARIRSLREDHDLTQERVGRPSVFPNGRMLITKADREWCRRLFCVP